MSENRAELDGRRILIVEDSPVVAPFAEEALAELGCVVVGTAPNMATAREFVEDKEFDAALVDVHIRGERVFALCDMMETRGIPFVLTSGYADWKIPERWEGAARLQKPYTVEQLQRVLEDLFRNR